MKNITLYHGSKGGIKGSIQPKSRKLCDFGQGFYMGTKSIQAQSLVYSKKSPMFYTLDVHLENIPESKILTLSGMDWAFHVLYNRNRVKELKNTDIYERMKESQKDKDFIIGPIADDSLNMVITEFENDAMTDKILLECMQCINYGMQYVAKTERACDQITITSKEKLNPNRYYDYQKYLNERRKESEQKIREIRQQYNNEGQYLYQILDSHKTTEKTISIPSKPKIQEIIPMDTPEEISEIIDFSVKPPDTASPTEKAIYDIGTHPKFDKHTMSIEQTGESVTLSQTKNDRTYQIIIDTHGFMQGKEELQEFKQEVPELYDIAKHGLCNMKSYREKDINTPKPKSPAIIKVKPNAQSTEYSINDTMNKIQRNIKKQNDDSIKLGE